MNLTTFWNMIAKAKDAKNVDEINAIIYRELNQLTVAELVLSANIFYELFDKAYTWNLWNAAYIIHGGCGDDSFMDFRKSLITLGEEIYEKALENPDFLATIENLEDKLYNEEFDYMFRDIYKQKTGKDIDLDPLYFIAPYKEPTGTKLDYDNPNFEEIILEQYPKITKRFW